MTIKCTLKDVNTIYTALLFELARNRGENEEVVHRLEEAIKAVKAAR